VKRGLAYVLVAFWDRSYCLSMCTVLLSFQTQIVEEVELWGDLICEFFLPFLVFQRLVVNKKWSLEILCKKLECFSYPWEWRWDATDALFVSFVLLLVSFYWKRDFVREFFKVDNKSQIFHLWSFGRKGKKWESFGGAHQTSSKKTNNLVVDNEFRGKDRDCEK